MKRIAIIGLCLLVLFPAVRDLRAAEGAATKPRKAQAAIEPSVESAWQRKVPRFQSDNLPLGEIVKQLRADFREINFIFKRQNNGDASGASITMDLRDVTLKEILKAIEVAADRPLEISIESDERLVVFEKRTVDPSGLPVEAPIATRVYNISSYLAQRPESEAAQALKEMEDVIHLAGEMLIRASSGARTFRPTLSVHPSTKLLIVVGRPEELALVEQVVTELQGREAKGSRKSGAANAQTAGETHGPSKQ